MRLIDADEFESYLINRYGGNDCADDIIDDLYNQPTVKPIKVGDVCKECWRDGGNVVEVVRCKDCKYWVVDSIFKTGWCNNKRRVMETSDDWFCADGTMALSSDKNKARK